MEYKGGSCVTQWIWSGGTLDLSSELRAMSIDAAIDVIDCTAGQDTNKQYLPSFMAWVVSWSGVAQDNGGAPQGTLYAQALLPRNAGTLLISPYGTAANALLYVGAALCEGAVLNEPYNDVTSITTKWKITSTGGGVMGVGHHGLFIVGGAIIGSASIGA